MARSDSDVDNMTPEHNAPHHNTQHENSGASEEIAPENAAPQNPVSPKTMLLNTLSQQRRLPEVDKAHFTPEEAAAYMNLPLATFRVLAADPALQPVRVMDAYLYRVADVQRFMLKMDAESDTP